MTRQRYLFVALSTAATLAAALLLGTHAAAAAPSSAAPADDAAAYRNAVDRAVNFLGAKAQAPDGSFSGKMGIGVTAVVTAGILRQGRSPDDPVVARSLKYLGGFVQPDGGIYEPGSFHKNYETSLCILVFAQANKDGRYKKLLAGADRFLRGVQWDESEGLEKSSVNYGGAGYGKHKRPDLSNTSFLIDALKAVGSREDDEAMKKALIFVSRCQNLETEHNTTPFAAKNPDGGFYYTPADGGASMAGKTPEGGLRSYGSMTYAGLKSMIYAGVGPDDPRVKAAFKWARTHYDLKNNPGMGTAGLYYYYHTFAKALDAMGVDRVKDAGGTEHDWRRELRGELLHRQQPDGSWLNPESPRWLEGDPALVTGYVLLTLDYARPGQHKQK